MKAMTGNESSGQIVSNQIIKRLLSLMLTGLVILSGLRAQDQEVELLKGVVVFLPSGSQVKADWVMPPLDPTILEKYGGRVQFSVDDDGSPVIGLGGRLLLNPVKEYCGVLSEPFRNLFHASGSLLLFSTEEDFGFTAPVTRLTTDPETGFPVFPYQPLALMPGNEPGADYIITDRRMFRGENCLYFLVTRAYQSSGSGYAQDIIYCLKGEPLSSRRTVKDNQTGSSSEETVSEFSGQTGVAVNGQMVYSSGSTDFKEIGTSSGAGEEELSEDTPKALVFRPVLLSEPVSLEELNLNQILAVTGDGDKTFFSVNDSIYEIDTDTAEPVLYYRHPEQKIIEALEFSREAGLIYRTFDSVGVADQETGLEFLKSVWRPEIFLKNGNLYVMLTMNAGIIRFENISDLKKYNSPEREILRVDGRKLGGGSPLRIGFTVFLILNVLVWLVALIRLLISDSKNQVKIFYLLWLLLGLLAFILVLVTFLFFPNISVALIFMLISWAIILSYFILGPRQRG